MGNESKLEMELDQVISHPSGFRCHFPLLILRFIKSRNHPGRAESSHSSHRKDQGIGNEEGRDEGEQQDKNDRNESAREDSNLLKQFEILRDLLERRRISRLQKFKWLFRLDSHHLESSRRARSELIQVN
jgi:hypothetical protein